MIKGLGHVGIICDDFMKMRDFYTRVIGLTVTDEDPERGSCFLSADPEHEHHELNLGQSRGPDHPDGARPKTQGLGQMSFIVPSLDDLRALNHRFQVEGTRILRTVTSTWQPYVKNFAQNLSFDYGSRAATRWLDK